MQNAVPGRATRPLMPRDRRYHPAAWCNLQQEVTRAGADFKRCRFSIRPLPRAGEGRRGGYVPQTSQSAEAASCSHPALSRMRERGRNRLRSPGQAQGELRAFPRHALEGDLAAHRLGELAGDGEAEPDALAAVAKRLLGELI